MINKNNEMEARADTAEKAVERLQDDVERLQENLREMKTKNDKKKKWSLCSMTLEIFDNF